MEPLIFIVAAGEGKRLYPETKDKAKPFLDIGDKKLIDLVIEPLSEGIEKAVLLKKARKFGLLEKHLRDKYGFDDRRILYQDRLTSSPYLPRKLSLSELPLAYYLSFLPTALSRNSRFIRQFDTVVLVPGDVIVEGLNYLDLIKAHTESQADITMPVQQEFVRGSNARVYTIENGRFVSASAYVNPPFTRQLSENERLYWHEGTYVLGRIFFDLPSYKFFRKDYRQKEVFLVLHNLRNFCRIFLFIIKLLFRNNRNRRKNFC